MLGTTNHLDNCCWAEMKTIIGHMIPGYLWSRGLALISYTAMQGWWGWAQTGREAVRASSRGIGRGFSSLGFPVSIYFHCRLPGLNQGPGRFLKRAGRRWITAAPAHQGQSAETLTRPRRMRGSQSSRALHTELLLSHLVTPLTGGSFSASRSHNLLCMLGNVCRE